MRNKDLATSEKVTKSWGWEMKIWQLLKSYQIVGLTNKDLATFKK